MVKSKQLSLLDCKDAGAGASKADICEKSLRKENQSNQRCASPGIDILMLRDELAELAGNLKVTVKPDRKLKTASSIRQTDRGFDVRLNPNKLKSPNKIEEHLNFCRSFVGGVGS